MLGSALLAGTLLGTAACTGGRASGPAPASSAGAGTPDRAGRTFLPGAAGLGDTYFPGYGNGGYDVAGYDLTLRYEPKTDRLTGQAVITAAATSDLSRFNLDFAELTVESVEVDTARAAFVRAGNELTITPPAGLPRGAKFTVDIRYSGIPAPVTRPGLGPEGFLHTADGALALGQPLSASGWFPVNDHPRDKATYTIAITVPDGLSVLSNGVPRNTSSQDGWTTWRWAERVPMASYLAVLAIGDYRVKSSMHNGKPLITAVSNEIPEGAADRAMARTGEVSDFLATQFGPYPFEAYGGIVHNDRRVTFALETQSRPIYASGFFAPGRDGTWVVVHELAHQWFGDSVSVHEWKDIWLNEGFATYAEWLWSEHLGAGTAEEKFDEAYRLVSGSVWTTPPGNPGAANLFSRSVYTRGAMTLHALRRTVGDQAFFRIAQTWAAEKRGRDATTAEFIEVAERISGRSLRPLFDAWLFKAAKPARP